MSTTIDERVVEMRFDGRQFETAVKPTLSTIDKLKQALNFKDSAKSLDGITDAAKRINMSGLNNAVDAVRLKFSALDVAAVTALANITNSAINAGKNITSALTIDPIKTGFQEYETQINAIQTILANTESKGSTLKDVNAALAELNTYADKTIYNFTQMTKNIGTFTAAGVDLNTSVSAIKGIANLAAVSGSTADQASTAMYQLSQALASGTVKLQDWNSVVNAGMGGEVFQSALKETAKVHGVAIDKMIKDEGSFRETLSKGWLTSNILTETLSKFTGDLNENQLKTMGYTDDQIASIIKMGQTANDAATKVKTFTQLFDTLKEAAQSGWTQSWQIIVGNFEEAKELLTEASNTFGALIGNAANARNELLSGGLSSAWDRFTSVFSEGMGETGLDAYKESIKSVAKEQGVAIDELIANNGSFEKSLKDGWLTSDIMTESLSKMTSEMGALSDKELEAQGYTRDQINALGEFNTEVQNGILSVDGLTEAIAKPSGRENVIQALRNSFNALLSIINPVKEAFEEIFPPMTAEQLYNITVGLEKFTAYLTFSDEQSDNLKRTFKGLFALLDIGAQAIIAIVGGFSDLIKYLLPAGDGLLTFTGSLGDWLVKLDVAIKDTNIFGDTVQGIVSIIKTAITFVKNLIQTIGEKINFPGFELFHAFLERVHTRMSQIGIAAGDMKTDVVGAVDDMGSSLANNKFLQALQALWNGVKIVAGGISKALGDLTSGLAKKLGYADFSKIFDLINSLSFGTIAIAINKFLKTDLSKPFKGLTDILDGVVGILDGVRNSLEVWQSNLKASTLLKIATAIGILAASILVISLIDSDKLAASLGSITLLFADLMGSMAIFGKISGTLTGVAKTCTAMISISIAVFILASALKKVGELSFGEMVTGLLGIVGLTATMIAAAKIMGSGSSTIIKGAAQMVIFAVAIKVLASACEDLSSLSWDELGKGLLGVGVLLGEVSLFLNTAKFGGKSITTATGIVIFAAAVKVLASACGDFAQMDWSEIGKGLTSIGILLLEITAFTNLTGNAKHVISTGIALIAIGAAMKIFASAIQDMGNMSWDELIKGLSGMGGVLLALIVALNLMPKNMIGMGAGLVIVSAALVIMAEALNKMGSMSWDEIGRGLVTLGGSMIILAAGLNLMTGTLAGSAAMLIAAAALAILAPTLSLLGAMSWESIAKGLLTLAGAFTIIGIAGLVLTPLVPVILALAGAFALICVGVLGVGVGLLAAGTGLSALAIGFAALAAASIAGATAVVASLTVIITGIAGLIPMIIGKIGEGIVAFAQAISNGAPAILEAITTVLMAITKALVTVAPAIADAVVIILTEVLETIAEYMPRIVEAVTNIIVALLDGIANAMPKIIQAGVDIIVAFVEGVGTAVPQLVDAGYKMIIDFLNGLAESIRTNTPLLVDAINNLADAIIDSAVEVFTGTGVDDFMKAGKNVVDGFIKGIKESMTAVADVAKNLGSTALTALRNVLDIHSPSKETEKDGVFSGQGLIKGITSMFSNVKKAGTQLGTTAMDGTTDGIKTGGKKVTKATKEVAKSAYDIAKEWIDERKYYNELSLDDELAKWQEVQTKYKEGSEDRKKIDREVYRVKNEIIANQFKNEKEFIEDEKFYKRANLDDELKYWIEIQDKYNSLGDDYDEQRNEADRKVFELQNDLIDKANDKQKEAAEKAFSNAKDWIDERLYYNDLSLKEELYAWEQIQDQYEEGTEKRKEADKEVYRIEQEISEKRESYAEDVAEAEQEAADKRIELEEEYYDKTKEINDQLKEDIADLNAEYDDAVKSRAESLYSAYNLFDHADIGSGVDGQTLIDNLGSQITSLEDWQKDINSLGDRGLASGLLDELQEMGPESASEIKALNALTDEQLNQYVLLWQQKHDLVKNQAVTELEDMRLQTVTKITELNASATIELDKYKTTWSNELAQVNANATTKLAELKSTFDTEIGSISSETKRKVRDLTDDIESNIVESSDEITGEVTQLTENIQTAMETPDWVSVGTNIILGIKKGILDKAAELAEAAAQVASDALDAAKEELDINSPSKKFQMLGQYCDEGFIVGLNAYSGKVSDASASVGSSALDSIKSTIARISDVVNSDIDTQPTIRPVLDLSDVASGVNTINALFSRQQAMSISTGINRGNSDQEIQNGVSTADKGNTFSLIQNNYSPKALSRVDIYRQTKNQFSAMERMLNT